MALGVGGDGDAPPSPFFYPTGLTPFGARSTTFNVTSTTRRAKTSTRKQPKTKVPRDARERLDTRRGHAPTRRRGGRSSVGVIVTTPEALGAAFEMAIFRLASVALAAQTPSEKIGNTFLSGAAQVAVVDGVTWENFLDVAKTQYDHWTKVHAGIGAK